MKIPKRQWARLDKVKFFETALQFYYASFKKLKYWLGIYYFVVFASIFVIPFDDWELLFSSNKIKKNNETINQIDILLKDWNPDSTKLKEIKQVSKNLFRTKIKFPAYDQTPFIFEGAVEGEYFRNRRMFLESKSKDIHGIVIPSLNKYFEQDSIKIIKKIDAYRRRYEVDIASDPLTYKESQGSRWNHALKLRDEMVIEINTFLDSLYTFHLEDSIAQSELKLLSHLKFYDDDLEKTYIAFKKENISGLDRLKSLEYIRIGKIPYIETQLTFKFLIILLNLFYLFCPFLLQLLHLNFKIYEAEIQKYNYALFRVQSLKNILFNLDLKGRPTRLLQRFALILILFVIPYLGVLINFILIFGALNLKLKWVILVIHLICFVVVWKLEIIKKYQNTRFILMHFK